MKPMMFGAAIAVMFASTVSRAHAERVVLLTDVTKNVRCDMAKFNADALKDGLKFTTTSGKLEYVVSSTLNVSSSVEGTLPIGTTGASANGGGGLTTEGSQTSTITIELTPIPLQKVPETCADHVVRTYDPNGQSLKPLRLSPLISYASEKAQFGPALATSQSIEQKRSFKITTSEDGGLSLNFVIFKIKVGAAKHDQALSGDYDVKFAIGKPKPKIGAKKASAPSDQWGFQFQMAPTDGIPVTSTATCNGPLCATLQSSLNRMSELKHVQ